MINISSNIAQVIQNVEAKMRGVNIDAMTREQASTVIGLMRTRVHEKGVSSDGSQIGVYSPGYMKVRSGTYGNAAKYSRGKNKGKNKNSGVFTKGKNKGSARPQYNRGSSSKVILSLTRQMENDMSIAPVSGGWAIGYNNPLNYKKARWNEQKYRKKIFNLSKNELMVSVLIAEKYIKEITK